MFFHVGSFNRHKKINYPYRLLKNLTSSFAEKGIYPFRFPKETTWKIITTIATYLILNINYNYNQRVNVTRRRLIKEPTCKFYRRQF